MAKLLAQLWARLTAKPARAPRPVPPPDPEPEEILVPELTVVALQQALVGMQPPLLLDVREPYEWRQVRLTNALHIPMNDLPARLTELPADRAIVVFCAHGSRSYSVAGYLIEQGYQASSLAGGITEWARQGGAIMQ